MSATRKPPRSLFKARRRGATLHVGRDPLPAVEAFVEAHRSRFKPGTAAQVIVAHDAHCRYPQGEACTCVAGPEIKLAGEDPEEN